MPRPRKPYTQKETTRHGTVVWYFRRGKGPRIRLPGAFGSREFNEAYGRALAGQTVEPKKRAPILTLRWLADRFYQSARFNALRPNTQRNYRLGLEYACRSGADLLVDEITKTDVKQGVMKREGTPHAAMDYLKSLRAVFAFAIDSGWIEANPTSGVSVKRPKSDGFYTWTVEDVQRFQAMHSVGTQARLALDIMLYTGLRRGDAIVLGRQHFRNGQISIRAGKNGAEILIPILPPLAKSIEATKTGDMVFLVNTRGQPWKNISFGYWFAKRCIEAGVLKGRAHGLRKAGATMAANNGATPFELTAMYGWSSTKVAEIYTAKADKARLAERAANKLYPHQPKGAGAGTLETLARKVSRKSH
jgi:integrase